MKSNSALLSSKKMDWQTPDLLYQYLDYLFNFDFDPCPANPDFDGLSIEWGESNYVNPPYGSEISKWIRKGYEEFSRGKRVVFLIPSRTDTRYWHNYIMQASEIWFVKRRIKFQGAEYNAPFPSVIVIFEPKYKGLLKVKAFNQECCNLHLGEQNEENN